MIETRDIVMYCYAIMSSPFTLNSSHYSLVHFQIKLMLHDSEFMSARDAQCYPDTKFPIQEVQFLKYCHNSHKHNVQFPQTKLL